MNGFLARLAITAIGLAIAAEVIPGFHVDETATLLWGALALGLVNAVVRPVAVILTLPITLLSLGLFLWVINAGMLAIAAWLLQGLTLDGFGSALLSALVISVTGWIGNGFIGSRGRIEVVSGRPG